ncbi:hypothetical protein C7M52_00445 [Mixta theicola]|nr:tail fiber assembly protein [Mixta theicola]QHM74510.1 hypothetical protein C7M52_00445 [Mixta theicola]
MINMGNFLNFKVYKKKSVVSVNQIFTCLYVSDEKDRIWYEVCEKWRAVISVDADRYVCGYETDASVMSMTEGHSLHKVDSVSVQEDVIGNYRYENGICTYIRPNAAALAEIKKGHLLSAVGEAIIPIQEAVNLGIATDEEKICIEEWKKYRVLLNRIDTSTMPILYGQLIKPNVSQTPSPPQKHKSIRSSSFTKEQ